LKKTKAQNMLTRFFNLLSSIPTVVYGFLGLIFFVPFIRNFSGDSGMNILSASLVLSLVITPTMVLFFIDTFKNVPKSYKTIVNSLGGDTIDYQMKVLLPYTFKSLSIGFIMGFSRAIGDTMIALMISGNSIVIPHSLNDSARTLTSHIALLFGGDFESMEFKSIFASGLILFLISICILLLIRFLRKSYAK
jgi:phosphate transport system permease protein